MSSSWYEVVKGGVLEQGDILFGLPVYTVEYDLSGEETSVQVRVDALDVVVLTQSCDLENSKVDTVLLADVVGYEAQLKDEPKESFLRSSAFKKAAIAGNLPAQSLLSQHEGFPAIPWSVVDFHHLRTSSFELTKRHAEASGERLRLAHPYKEHLAQAFARYMMRVGLPTGLTGFQQVGK